MMDFWKVPHFYFLWDLWVKLDAQVSRILHQLSYSRIYIWNMGLNYHDFIATRYIVILLLDKWWTNISVSEQIHIVE